MRPSQLLAAVLAMSSTTVALSGAFDNIHGVADAKNILFGRQDNSDNASSDQPKSTAQSAKPTATDNNDNASSGTPASGSGKATGSASKATTGKPKPTSFDPRLPAGGISMVTPDALAGDQFYKVGDFVTFAWNFTSLSVTPSNIDVLASCTANQATYTIAVNMSASETKVLWDTKNTPDGQAPFLTERYTLMIYDSNLTVTATPKAGYLAAFTQFTFGMYTPQPYVPWDQFNCANCNPNGALSQFERMTLSAIIMTTGTTLGSLLYFSHAFGLL
jgi:hypothetical protein